MRAPTPKRKKPNHPLLDIPIEDWVALDTETTGLSVPHGDRPFVVTAWTLREDNPAFREQLIDTPNPGSPSRCFLPGRGAAWSAPVDYETREPAWTPKQVKSIAKVLNGKPLVLFNAGFDLRMLRSIGLVINCESWIAPVEFPEHYCDEPVVATITVPIIADAQYAKHVFDNRGPKDLDGCCSYYLGLSIEDEHRLVDALDSARRWVRKYIPEASMGTTFAGKAAVKSDYWMVHQLASDPRCQNRKSYQYEGRSILLHYALNDVFRTIALWDYAREQIVSDGLEAQLIRQHDVQPLFVQMDTEGMPIDRAALRPCLKEHQTHSEKLETELDQLMKDDGILTPNVKSPMQVRMHLTVALGLKSERKTTKTKEMSVGKDTIEEFLEDPTLSNKARNFLQKYQDYALSKKTTEMLMSTFQQRRLRRPYDGDYDRIEELLFGSFIQTGTSVTRCSSREPNLQNIPKSDSSHGLRRIIHAIDGYSLVSIDYAQVELRLFVAASGDPDMKAALAAGEDLHTLVASAAFEKPKEEITTEERRIAKGINFGRLYGAGRAKLIALAGSDRPLKLLDARFPNVAKFLHSSLEAAKKTGYIHTLYGYRVWVAPEPPHKACNCVVQGSAGDAMKEAMTRLGGMPGYLSRFRIIGQVHDELLFLVKKKPNGQPDHTVIKLIAATMESAGNPIDTYLPVETTIHTAHWGDKG